MAKKRFTDGLATLFDNAFDGSAPELEANDVQSPEAAADTDKVSLDIDVPVKTKKARKKLSNNKGFTSSLDFLNETFENEGFGNSRKTSRRTGLDFLIRSTVDPTDEDRFPEGGKEPDTKRVTLIFHKDHLAELKEIAKKRNIFLKDLVREMVVQFLDK